MHNEAIKTFSFYLTTLTAQGENAYDMVAALTGAGSAASCGGYGNCSSRNIDYAPSQSDPVHLLTVSCDKYHGPLRDEIRGSHVKNAGVLLLLILLAFSAPGDAIESTAYTYIPFLRIIWLFVPRMPMSRVVSCCARSVCDPLRIWSLSVEACILQMQEIGVLYGIRWIPVLWSSWEREF